MAELPGLGDDFNRLASEQDKIQKDKFQGRDADEYDEYIFLGNTSGDRTSEVEEFLKSKLSLNATSLEGVIESLINKIMGKYSGLIWVEDVDWQCANCYCHQN